jgi:hypothetical protein
MSWGVWQSTELVYDPNMSSNDTPSTMPEPDPDVAVAAAAGALNLAHAELTRVAAGAMRDGTWSGTSPVQWLTYRAGITTSRANTILAVADKRESFPTITARFDAGELSLEQVYELVQAPPCADADIEHWGTVATPARIRRSIKRRYGADTTSTDDADSTESDDDVEVSAPFEERVERDWVSAGITDDHRFRIRGEYDLDTGQLIQAALLQAREQLWAAGQRTISDADCLREIVQRFLDGIDTTPLQRDRSKIWIHLDANAGTALTSTGVRVPDSVRDKICCDGIVQPVWERDGVPFNLGRARHLVPERTRRIVMLRDQGCRVPGCNHDRIIEIHHIIHWQDGGPTSTWNLVALCPRHHRMHHQGTLGITGNADDPDGLVFTDHRGRQLRPCGAPTPPTRLDRPINGYTPPLRGRVDWNYVGLGWPDPPPD